MIKYILLGVIQGLTEFLPVSSSGHLVIMRDILKVNENAVALSVVLHLGTVLALLVFFFKDILKLFRSPDSLFKIIIVTIITGTIAVSGKNFFESLFGCVKAVAIGLLFTGIVLIMTKKFMQPKRNNLTIKDAFILGFVQAIAIIPGISRSGITISTLLFRGIDRETSFRFSFLAAIPAIFGAALLELKDIRCVLGYELKNFAVGFTFSFLTGILSLWFLKIILRRAKWHYFGYYCILVAVIILLFK